MVMNGVLIDDQRIELFRYVTERNEEHVKKMVA